MKTQNWVEACRHTIHTKEKVHGLSKTVPNQVFTPQELLKRAEAGMGLPPSHSTYFEEEVPFYEERNHNRSDIHEQEQIVKEGIEQIMTNDKEVKRMRKEEAEAKKLKEQSEQSLKKE